MKGTAVSDGKEDIDVIYRNTVDTDGKENSSKTNITNVTQTMGAKKNDDNNDNEDLYEEHNTTEHVE